MKSVIKYFFYIFIIGFTLTATAQKQQKLEVSVFDASPNSLPGPISMNRTTESIWDILFSFDVTLASGASGNGGSEFDGTYYYTTRWASNLIHKYDMTGTLVEEFSIAGVTGLRDLAFDGTFMYGGAAGSVIYQMDFVTKTLIGTIPVTGVTVRHIAYDAGADGFWCGNWADSPTLFDRSGTQLASIVTGLFGQYGSAYDDISVGGPFLWIFDLGGGAGNPQLIHQFDIASGLATGVMHDVAPDAIDPTGIAGGLWISTDHTSGFQVMGVLVRGVPDEIIVYENPGGPPCPVGYPSNPDPPDGAVDVDIGLQEISWTNGANATELEVFFGIAGNMNIIYQGTLVTTLWINPLEYSTTYQWRVDGSDGNCTTLGPVWSFTTADDPNIYCVFMDDFEAGSGNWNITNDGGTCVWEVWDITTNGYTLPFTAEGNILTADSDECGSGTTLLSTVTMVNPLNLSDYSSVWIEFDNDWRTISADDEAYIELSTDGGNTWIEVLSWLGVDQRDTHEIWGVSSYAAFQSDVRFRLRVIQPGWDWWWAIDNFAVYADDCLSCINPPSDLTAIAHYENGSFVILHWVDNSNDEETFHIERKLGGSGSTNEYSEIATVSANVTTYTDNTVADTTMYTYRVRAKASWGAYSFYSNEAEVMTLIPVELTSFEGNVVDGNVQLIWTTATETNNLGFSIERRQTSNVKRDNNWNKIGFVQGHGTTTEPQNYSFMDESILSGTYQYRLKQVDYDGSYEYSNIIEVEVGIPTEFSLEQNYPNPFNPTTKIRFSIPAVETGHAPSVRLIVYDILGNEIATLVNEEKEAGIYEVEFDATGITSGIYFYKLQAGSFAETKKMIILK